jgi:succinate-semialdehyde dehydrogenase/glutarate-semialdehyde dehydrogenase
MTAVAEGELRVVNPATLEFVASVPTTPAEAVPGLVADARRAQERWGRTPLEERRALLRSVARTLLERVDDVADAIVAETGKPRTEAYSTELSIAVDSLVWLAAEAPKILAPERLRYPQLYLKHKRGWLIYEPRGVIGVIAPWNFPFSIPFTQAVAAVVAGNAVVLKPSELTPLTGAWVERLFADAGAPAGLVRVAQGDGRIGEALVRARPDKVVFTGSAEVGRIVAAAAGERLVPVTLELGGKDAMLVLDDADLDRAVEGALWSSFFNAGQVCSGVERIYVDRRVFEPFVDGLVRRTRDLRLGVDIGPLISEEQRARVERLVDDALARGAHARIGGRTPAGTGWFYEPTVLADVPQSAPIDAEEIFGPVVTVAQADNDDDLVRRANDSSYGLGASVWTRNAQRAAGLARRLEAGSVWHNDHAYSYGSAQASWGGRKESGFGRTHSKHGLYELVNVKFVDRDSGRVPVAYWFPYDERTPDALRTLLRVFAGDHRLRAAWRGRRELLHVARRYRR